MENEIITTKEYRDWLVDVKRRVQSAQLKAATAVNTTLLEFYGSLGADIAEKQKNTGVIVKLCGMGIREVEKGRKKAYPDF